MGSARFLWRRIGRRNRRLRRFRNSEAVSLPNSKGFWFWGPVPLSMLRVVQIGRVQRRDRAPRPRGPAAQTGSAARLCRTVPHRGLPPTEVCKLMMQRIMLLVALATCIVVGTARGQQDTGALAGAVTDAKTGDTIPGASVSISDLQAGAATGADGSYRIEGLPVGTY